jgi:hypothetical protein
MRRWWLCLFIVLVALICVNNQIINELHSSIHHLRAEIGPGRGHVLRARDRHFAAIDLYQQLANQGDGTFLAVVRFTRGQFDDIVRELRPLVIRNMRIRPGTEPHGQPRACKLTVENRVLLAIKFLVTGASCADLGSQFGLSPQAVSENIRHVMFALVETLHYEVAWPTAAQRATLHQIMGPRFANSFGTVDGTFTPSRRRVGDYSGHRHSFVRAHQIAADALGYIVHVVAGQIGARHDAFNYQRSNLPDLLSVDGERLLADEGYEGCDNVVLPASPADIADEAVREQHNKQHKSRRSRIEQFIGLLKALFKTVARRWDRPDRGFLSVCVLACCMLYNRRKRFQY